MERAPNPVRRTSLDVARPEGGLRHRLPERLCHDADQRARGDIQRVMSPARNLNERHSSSGRVGRHARLRVNTGEGGCDRHAAGRVAGGKGMPFSATGPERLHFVAPLIQEKVRPRARDEML